MSLLVMHRRFLLASCVLAGGCGSVDASSPPEGPGADDPAVQAEVASIEAALGEATCATTSADHLRPATQPDVLSHTNAYDHPTCRDAYVIDAPGLTAGTTMKLDPSIAVGPNVFVNLFACGLNASWFYLYEKQATGYVLVSQGSAFGTIQGRSPLFLCHADVTLTVPRDGDYKLVTASRQLLGDKNPIAVMFR